jgi:hypothetical protein
MKYNTVTPLSDKLHCSVATFGVMRTEMDMIHRFKIVVIYFLIFAFLQIMWAEYSDIDVVLSDCCHGSEIYRHDEKCWNASAYVSMCVWLLGRVRKLNFQTHCVHSWYDICIYFLLYITLFKFENSKIKRIKRYFQTLVLTFVIFYFRTMINGVGC